MEFVWMDLFAFGTSVIMRLPVVPAQQLAPPFINMDAWTASLDRFDPMTQRLKLVFGPRGRHTENVFRIGTVTEQHGTVYLINVVCLCIIIS